LTPGFQTSAIALAILWAPLVKEMEFLRKRGKVLRIGEEGERNNGGRVKM